MAEFGNLFDETVMDVEWLEPTRLRLRLRPTPEVAARTAELVSRETQCCSFFAFTLRVTGGSLTLEVTVPAQHAAVLDVLQRR